MERKGKKILNVILSTIAFILAVFLLSILLKKLGVTDQESLKLIIKKTGAWGPIVFFLLQVVITTLLSVIPGTSLTFLLVAGVIFDNIWLAIFLPLLGVWISSILMFTIGNTLGEKAAIKLVGKDSLEQAQNLIDTKTKIYLSLMFLFPFFPDDGLCLAAGLTKIKYSYFIPVVIIFRSFGVITTILTTFYHKSIIQVLGLKNLLPIEWILLVNILIIDIYFILKFTKWLEHRINKKKAMK